VLVGMLEADGDPLTTIDGDLQTAAVSSLSKASELE
jgi:hypothetical protein